MQKRVREVTFSQPGLSMELVEQCPLGYRLKAGEISVEVGERATKKGGPDAEFVQETG